MKRPAWLRPRPRPTARGDLAFMRRWAVVLVPAWGLAGLAAWTLPDSTYHDTTRWTNLAGLIVGLAFLLPDNCTRLRRAAEVYVLGVIIYMLAHNLARALGQVG